MKLNVQRLSIIFLAIFTVLTLTSIIAKADDPRTHLRIVHAAPWLQNVDIYVSDTLFFDNLFYRYISDYVPISSADNNEAEAISIKVRPADSPPDFPTFTEPSPTLNKNTYYSFIIAGTLEDRQAWIVTDETELPGTGTSLLRIIHASLGTPSTEFCVADVCRTLAFKQDTGYFLMDPGTYTPVVRPNGVKASPIKVPPLVLQDNSIHTVFLTGQRQAEPGLQLLYTFDAGDPNLNPHPESPSVPGNSPGEYGPPPVYPPVSGAFLSLRAMGIIAGIILIIVGGIGFWFTRKPRQS